MRAIRNPADAAKFAASVIRRHVPDPAYRVFLFGSRATGSAGERSDIDIGIEGPAPVSRAALAAIHDEFELRQLPIGHQLNRHREHPRNSPGQCRTNGRGVTFDPAPTWERRITVFRKIAAGQGAGL